MNAALCPTCGDRRHVKTPAGWRRCACSAHALILPALRQGDATYPEAYNQETAWPWANLVIVGDYTVFRHRAWRSLVEYPDRVVEAFDVYQLIDIHFEHDSRYASIRDAVAHLDLLILAIGVAEMPHSYLGPVAVQALTMRAQHGRPTWFYTPRPVADLRVAYSDDLCRLLTPWPAYVSGAVRLGAPTTPASPAQQMRAEKAQATALVNPATGVY